MDAQLAKLKKEHDRYLTKKRWNLVGMTVTYCIYMIAQIFIVAFASSWILNSLSFAYTVTVLDVMKIIGVASLIYITLIVNFKGMK